MFDETTRVGGFTFDPSGDVEQQLEELAAMLTRKMAERDRDEPREPIPLLIHTEEQGG